MLLNNITQAKGIVYLGSFRKIRDGGIQRRGVRRKDEQRERGGWEQLKDHNGLGKIGIRRNYEKERSFTVPFFKFGYNGQNTIQQLIQRTPQKQQNGTARPPSILLINFVQYQLSVIKSISMWNIFSSNKLLQQKSQDKQYQAHLDKLKKMKPTIKLQPPQQPLFVYLKPKTEMNRREKLLTIDRENEILNNKMIAIKNAAYKENILKPQSQKLKTLNQAITNSQQMNIYHENQRMCTKLLGVSTFYPTFQFLKESQVKERVKHNISQNARRSLSLRSAQKRPDSSLTRSSKFYRSRINKYDNEGNSSTEKINILYKLNSEQRTRPDTAPTTKKSFLISKHPQESFNIPKMADTEQLAKQFQTNIPSQHDAHPFSPQ